MRYNKEEARIKELLLIGTCDLCINTKERYLEITLDHDDRVKQFDLTFITKTTHNKVEIDYSFNTKMLYLYYYMSDTRFILNPCNCMKEVIDLIKHYEGVNYICEKTLMKGGD